MHERVNVGVARMCAKLLPKQHTQIFADLFTRKNKLTTHTHTHPRPTYDECKRANERFSYSYPLNVFSQAYPFADLFSSFGGFSVPHNTELNPIIEPNQIATLKTDVKVPQVENLNAAETMVKLFEWQTHRSRAAKLKAHPSITLKAAFMCADIEIPILVIDGDEKAFIKQSNDNRNDNRDDFDWANYPKVSDISVKTRHGYRTTLGDVLAEVSRPKPNSKPLQYAPNGSLIQGGQQNANEPQMVQQVESNSLTFNDKYDEQFKAQQYAPCTNSLCNGQEVYDRANFPVFNVQFFQ